MHSGDFFGEVGVLTKEARSSSAIARTDSELLVIPRQAFLNAEGRLARLLLQLGRKELEKGYITISQEELAERTGQTRQTVAKALGRWRRAGWLITGRGRIMLQIGR